MNPVSLIRLWAIIFLCWRWEKTEKDLALNKWNRKLGTALPVLHGETYLQLPAFNISHHRSCLQLMNCTEGKETTTTKTKNPAHKRSKKKYSIIPPSCVWTWTAPPHPNPLRVAATHPCTALACNNGLNANWKEEVGENEEWQPWSMSYVMFQQAKLFILYHVQPQII